MGRSQGEGGSGAEPGVGQGMAETVGTECEPSPQTICWLPGWCHFALLRPLPVVEVGQLLAVDSPHQNAQHVNRDALDDRLARHHAHNLAVAREQLAAAFVEAPLRLDAQIHSCLRRLTYTSVEPAHLAQRVCLWGGVIRRHERKDTHDRKVPRLLDCVRNRLDPEVRHRIGPVVLYARAGVKAHPEPDSV